MRIKLGISASIVLLGASMALAEGPILRFWRDVGRSSARNNAWPDPFTPNDRAAARAPFEIMVNNGWRYNNTLADHHYDDAGRLNEAGERLMQTILQQYPSGRRMIYVLNSNDPIVTSTRLDHTWQIANKYVLPGDHLQIGQTTIRPEGWPASFVVAVDRSYSESMPQPRIPSRAGGDSSSASTGT